MSSPEIERWADGVLDIPIQDDLVLDTHSTGGEHLTKELYSWQTYCYLLESAGLSLPDDIKDPILYYMSNGEGRFHRAYYDGDMIAGMTTRPDSGGRTVDTFIGVADPSLVATAVQEMLTRNILGEFAGVKPLPFTKHVSMPGEIARQNVGFQRAIYDFAVRRSGSFVIPMPNIVTPMLDLEATELEKAKQARPSDFSGVLRYVVPEAQNTFVEEFYRRGQFIGKITTVSPDEFIYQPDVSASDADGEAVILHEASYRGPEREIRFLKTIAEGNPQMAELFFAA